MTQGSKGFLNNLKFTAVAQAVILMASLAKSLVLPNLLGVESFSYWQTYSLYSGLATVFTLGFADGVYILYAGKPFSEQTMRNLRGAIRLYTVFVCAICAIAMAVAFAEPVGQKKLAYFFAAADIIPICLSGVFLLILQIQERMAEYGKYGTLDKVLILFFLVFIVVGNCATSWVVIVADWLARMVALFALLRNMKEFYIGNAVPLRIAGGVFARISRTGTNVLLAGFLVSLTSNIGRMIIERSGDVSGFAYYSFGLSIASLVLTFINATSMALYPSLKNSGVERSSETYSKIVKLCTLLCIASLAFLLPIELFLIWVFPKYEPTIQFLPCLLAMMAIQCKTQVVDFTYLKALRMERALLWVNAACFAATFIGSLVVYILTHSIFAVILVADGAMLVAMYAFESLVRKALNARMSPIELVFLACLAAYVPLALYLPHGVMTLLYMLIAALFGWKMVRNGMFKKK